ncbi:MAG: hypothetical protein Q8O24_02080 [Gallionellaceae bacterium]|nr:hypothetical protein [Gallionellaceae bacterium]
MNKAEIKSIIEATLKSGSKTPGMFELPKMLGIRGKLESCESVADVLSILEENRPVLSKAFGISDELFNSGVEKLKALA